MIFITKPLYSSMWLSATAYKNFKRNPNQTYHIILHRNTRRVVRLVFVRFRFKLQFRHIKKPTNIKWLVLKPSRWPKVEVNILNGNKDIKYQNLLDYSFGHCWKNTENKMKKKKWTNILSRFRYTHNEWIDLFSRYTN